MFTRVINKVKIRYARMQDQSYSLKLLSIIDELVTAHNHRFRTSNTPQCCNGPTLNNSGSNKGLG